MDSFSVGAGGVEAVCAEQGAGEPLLLLHGWGATARVWRHLWPAAVPRFRCLAPDLPGWGHSDKPDAPYTPEWYADWVGALLDARFAPEAHVVGHSMGAMVAAVFAIKNPQRVRRLVLCNAPIVGADAFTRRTRLLVRPVIRRLAWWLSRTRPVRRWIAKDFTHVAPWDTVDVDNLALGCYGAMVRSVRGMMATDLRFHLQGVRAPSLVFSSTHDAVIRPEQAELARQALPQAEHHVFQETGHCPMLERPEEFNRAVLDFLGRGHKRPPQW